jgi:hypothetical protein
MEPPESLRKIAAKNGVAKAKTAATPTPGESVPMPAVPRARGALLVITCVLGIGAAVGAYFLVRANRKPAELPTPPAPTVAAPTPSVLPPVAPPVKAKKRRHRVEPLEIGARNQPKNNNTLPHKTTTAAAPKSTSPATVPDDIPAEAAPLTEAEKQSQKEASINADGVRFVIQKRITQIHACYSRYFKNNSPGGRVEIGFAIDLNGKAQRVRTESNTTGSDEVGKCIEQRLREWEFPKPVGGEAELIYPFVFTAGS